MNASPRPISSPSNGGLPWMDLLRALAITAVIIHHWLKFIPLDPGSSMVFSAAAQVFGEGAGTFVHLFFFLSGCGLAYSHLAKADPSWKAWAKRRLQRILVPYWVIVLLAFLWAGLSAKAVPAALAGDTSSYTLFAYLTLTRNFYPPGFPFNPTLWFMPVICGMYGVFPFLAAVLKRRGVFTFLALSFLITYASITLALFAGYPDDHQSAIFSFHLLEFCLGMAMGREIFLHPGAARKFLGLKPFLAGLVCCTVSLAMVLWWSRGPAYNDAVTLIGVFLMGSNICDLAWRGSPHGLGMLLKKIAGASYLMYLLHGPVILYAAKPLIVSLHIRVTPPILILAGLLMGLSTYFLARIFSPPLTWITSRQASPAPRGPNPSRA